MMIWIVFFAGEHAMELFDKLGGGILGIIMTTLVAIKVCIFVLVVLPGTLYKFTVVTSI